MISYSLFYQLFSILGIENQEEKYCQCSSLRDRFYGYYKGFNKINPSKKQNLSQDGEMMQC